MRQNLEELRCRARLKGTDKQFLDWIRTMPSCISGHWSEWPNGDPRNPACHVRRAIDSGTAMKPEFSAVPMTNEEHHDQTIHGEAHCLNRHLMPFLWTQQQAKDWFDTKVRQYLTLWIIS